MRTWPKKNEKPKTFSWLRLTYYDGYTKIDTFFLRRPSPMTEMKHTENTQKSLHAARKTCFHSFGWLWEVRGKIDYLISRNTILLFTVSFCLVLFWKKKNLELRDGPSKVQCNCIGCTSYNHCYSIHNFLTVINEVTISTFERWKR